MSNINLLVYEAVEGKLLHPYHEMFKAKLGEHGVRSPHPKNFASPMHMSNFFRDVKETYARMKGETK